MQELELTSAHLLRIWWSLTWRLTGLFLLMFASVMLACAVAGLGFLRLGVPYADVVRMGGTCLMIATLAGLPVMLMVALRQTMRNRLGPFRIALLGPAEKPDQENCAASAG
jgi:hypothetical protein